HRMHTVSTAGSGGISKTTVKYARCFGRCGVGRHEWPSRRAANPTTVAASPRFGFHSRPMRLYYYQDSYGNFGDELNEWLWRRVLPPGFNRSDNALLLGIGTLIRQEVPETAIKVVLGAGAGYG